MPDSTPLSVHHLAVEVEDLERAEAFYVGVLDLPVLVRHPDDEGRPRSFWVGIGEGRFLAVERGARRVGRGGWLMTAFHIRAAEREMWRSRLEAAGHPIVRETANTLYCEDPEGNLVGFSHYPLFDA